MAREMWDELREGSTDGALKKARPDTSGVQDDETASALGLLQNAVNAYDRVTGGDAAKRAYTRGLVRE